MTLLSPRSVAIIGASTQPGKVGHDIVNNLVTEEFMGKIYPVNPKADTILGLKAYPSVRDIPGEVDLAVIVIPAAAVPAALEECGHKGIKNVVVISAGFKEVHSEVGAALEDELVAIARRHGISLVGPNCLGILRPSRKMNASFAKGIPPVGNVTLISQSGATAVGIMDLAPGLGLGFASVFSIGNKSVLNESDFLTLCAEDPDTHVIGLYLESIEDGRRFLETAASITPRKRIVLLKSGVSEHGKKAAASHTGALAGSDAAIDALCTQSGIVRARSMEEFLDLLCTLSHQPRLLSNNVAVLTNAGGPGILATDACERTGLALPPLSQKIAATLKPALPATASIGNPIDLIGDAKTDRYEAGLIACRDDAGIDGLIVILTPQIMTPSEEIADALVRIMKTAPLMPVVACFHRR
jgi:acetyl coenzyme A synthetase (ADP forming)-like protein